MGVSESGSEQLHRGKGGTSWAIRWLLGAVAIWPLLAGLVVVVVEVVHEKSGYALPLAISVWVAWLYFVFDAAFAGRVPRAKVRLWVVTLLLGHVFAMIFYWYFYIARNRGRDTPRNRARG